MPGRRPRCAEGARDLGDDETMVGEGSQFGKGDAVGVAIGHATHDLECETCLADAARSGEGGEPRPLEQLGDLEQHGLASDQPFRLWVGRLRLRLEPRVLEQDRSLELLQRRRRLDPELFDEEPAAVPVDGESFGLPAAAVEREHQLSAEALAEWIPVDESLELRNQLGVAAGGEIELDPVLERTEARLREAGDLRLSPGVVGEVAERSAPPQPESLSWARDAQALEALDVELVRQDRDHVARLLREDPVPPQLSAELRHVGLDELRRARGRGAVPEALDQTLRGNDLVCVEEQEREQGARLVSLDSERGALADLERPEEPELHRH